jgi:tetratricopeptide (TPR) repeat protein
MPAPTRRDSLQAALTRAEAGLAARPDDRALGRDRARLLHHLGRSDEAQQAYLQLLAVDPADLATLTQCGALLRDLGYLSAAITLYTQAQRAHPGQALPRILLGNALLDQGRAPEARAHFEAALALEPGAAEAHQGLATALMELREEAAAWEHARRGFAGRPPVVNPYRGAGAPIRLLVLNSAAGGNIPLRRNLDDRLFEATLLLAEFADPKSPLPPHDLVLNAIGDADYCRRGLAAAAALLAGTRAPVINPPAAVALTGRADNARRLGALPGIRTPRTVLLSRAQLAAPGAAAALGAQGLGFPLLIRAVGFQAGKHFVKVDAPAGLAAALKALPGDAFAAIEFLDARAADGRIRKYRVMMIGGELYPLHAAVSPDWKIHYFSADMAGNAAHRREDQAFLEGMPGVLGPAALAALQGLATALGLDYAGADLSLAPDGTVLLFEANATMVLLPPGPDPAWDYRRAPVQRALDALTALLTRRARGAA